MKIASVVLAAGLGKRMHSSLPKTLHPLLGKPIVFHALDAVLPHADFPPVLVTGFGSELVREEVAHAYGEKVCFALQAEQLGTGHAVRSTEDQLRGKADLLLVTFGDMPMLRPETSSVSSKFTTTQHCHDDERIGDFRSDQRVAGCGGHRGRSRRLNSSTVYNISAYRRRGMALAEPGS